MINDRKCPGCQGALIGIHKICHRCAETRLHELEALINNPEIDDFLDGVRLEAVHQVERYPRDPDATKTAWDWFWLIGFLAQKAATAAAAGDMDKARHHTISTSAAMMNWHHHLMQGRGGT